MRIYFLLHILGSFFSFPLYSYKDTEDGSVKKQSVYRYISYFQRTTLILSTHLIPLPLSWENTVSPLSVLLTTFSNDSQPSALHILRMTPVLISCFSHKFSCTLVTQLFYTYLEATTLCLRTFQHAIIKFCQKLRNSWALLTAMQRGSHNALFLLWGTNAIFLSFRPCYYYLACHSQSWFFKRTCWWIVHHLTQAFI